MERVSRGQLKEFVHFFIEHVKTIISQYPNVELIFPGYIRYPYKIKCIISKKNGVAIEFLEPNKDWEITVRKTDKLIEEEVFHRISDSSECFFVANGDFTRIENVNLVTGEFYSQFRDIVEYLFKSTTFVVNKPGTFVRVNRGSIKLINVGVGYTKNGKIHVRNIKFLWLIGTNTKDYFTEENAKQHAVLEVRRYLDALIPRIPINMLVYALSKFEKLIYKDDVSEQEMQEFLEVHPYFLWIGYETVEPNPILPGGLKPDFIIKSHDGKYIVVEIESPKKKLFTKGKTISEYKHLKDAKAQIEGYLSYIKNNIEHLRSWRYSDIKVEKVHGLLVIGLSTDLTSEERDRLKQLNAELKSYEIRTYDELAKRFRQFLENMGVKYGLF